MIEKKISLISGYVFRRECIVGNGKVSLGRLWDSYS